MPLVMKNGAGKPKFILQYLIKEAITWVALSSNIVIETHRKDKWLIMNLHTVVSLSQKWIKNPLHFSKQLTVYVPRSRSRAKTSGVFTHICWWDGFEN